MLLANHRNASYQSPASNYANWFTKRRSVRQTKIPQVRGSILLDQIDQPIQQSMSATSPQIKWKLDRLAGRQTIRRSAIRSLWPDANLWREGERQGHHDLSRAVATGGYWPNAEVRNRPKADFRARNSCSTTTSINVVTYAMQWHTLVSLHAGTCDLASEQEEFT